MKIYVYLATVVSLFLAPIGLVAVLNWGEIQPYFYVAGENSTGKVLYFYHST